MLSCIDCADDDFPVYQWDGNVFNDAELFSEPSDELWQLEGDTFVEWMTHEIEKLQLSLQPQPGDTARETYKKPRWWKFW